MLQSTNLIGVYIVKKQTEKELSINSSFMQKPTPIYFFNLVLRIGYDPSYGHFIVKCTSEM